MAKYLGETVVDVNTHPEYSKYTNVDWAMLFIEKYGGIDGDHHKAWVLDQATRCLKNTPVEVFLAKWDDGETEYRFSTGKPSKEYKKWVKSMIYGDYTSYDEGIAP